MILSGLFFGLVVFIFSCTGKEKVLAVKSEGKQALQQRVDKGDLLNTVSESGEDYEFAFESGIVRVSKQEIANILPEPDLWKTVLIFQDHSKLAVPSKGNSLDFIVEQIELNPSGYNPLAAIVRVKLPTFGRVKVTIHGKTGDRGTITHLLAAETAHQDVPVLGLYADHENVVDITFTDREGKERGATQVKIRTKPLDIQDFPRIHIVKAEPDNMEPGLNLVSYPGMSELDMSIPYMVDAEGEVRWILYWKSSAELQRLSASIGLKRTKKGTFIAGDQATGRIIEVDVFGNLLKQWDISRMGYSFHHEIAEAQNGNFLVTVTRSDAKLQNGHPRINDFIIELDPGSGSLVNEWDLATMLDTSRYVKPDGITPPQFSQNPTNWAHNNSIAEYGSDYVASMRYQGIMGFTPNGKLLWLISPHKLWSARFAPYLLNPVDEQGNAITDGDVINGDTRTTGFDWAWGPHTPVVLPNKHILVFDNGYNRNWISNMIPGVTNFSRAVEYSIDESKRTVQQVWAYGQERGEGAFSQALSGVQYLTQTGHILFCPGMGVPTSIGSGGRVIELEPAGKNVVFEMEIAASSNTAFHRVTRMPLYPDNL